jgi:hypothetical protein
MAIIGSVECHNMVAASDLTWDVCHTVPDHGQELDDKQEHY